MLFKFSFDFCLSLKRYHVTKINYRNKKKNEKLKWTTTTQCLNLILLPMRFKSYFEIIIYL